ncbi:MAG: cytochrome P450 [Actinomycetota bacterium]|nr:cytochrome P450 [Actinomycetota bacterium]
MTRASRPNVRAGLEFRRDPLGFLLSLDDGDELVRFRAGLTDFALIKNPATIHRILVADAALYGEGKWTLRGERVMRDCLITLDGARHRDRRALLRPGFDRRRLVGTAQNMVERADRLDGLWQDGATIDTRAEMRRLALAATGEALFSLDLEPEADALVPALATMLKEISRPGLPWPAGRRLAAARKVVDRTVTRAVAQRRENQANDDDVLSLLLGGGQNGHGRLTDAEIADEMVSLLMAAVDTTPGTLAWTWHLLARHPEVEARVHEELDAVLHGRRPNAEDLPRLEYLGLVLTEVLRLYPPVHFIDRRPVVDVELDGHRIAAGSFLLLSPLLTHRDPRLYEEPTEFRPERWTRERQEDRPRYGYFPFGGGPHACIGMTLARMEILLVVATLARHWRMRVSPDLQDLSPQTTILPMALARR